MNAFKDILESVIISIAQLAYGNPEWIKSEIKVRYQPYIREHYEDADEYFEAIFEGYYMGETTATYKVQLRPTLDVVMWAKYNGVSSVLHVSNQKKIQDLLATQFKNNI